MRGIIMLFLGCAFLVAAGQGYAQSTTASLSGRISDANQALLPSAAVVLTNRETAAVRTATSDPTGGFRITTLPPGPYDVRVELPGFSPLRLEIGLVMGEDRRIDLIMTIATINSEVTVTAAESLVDPTETVLGRRITVHEIADLPVQGRLFLNLALLTPGVLNSYNTAAAGSGFASAGQTGRNNTILVDGLALDDVSSSSPRGGLPLDAVSEFVVASNAATAEYGQASGAVVNVRTKSGSNRFAGIASAHYRNYRWNATPGAAVLAVPPLAKPEMEQTIISSSLGGPIVRNRSFFFGAFENAIRDSMFIVTSPQAPLLAPDEVSTFPQKTSNPQVFARWDTTVGESSQLTVRYRLGRETIAGRMGDQDQLTGTRQRAHDSIKHDDDFAVMHTLTMGPKAVNELRVQRAGRLLEFDPTGYCSGCPALEYPHLKLGKNPGVPTWRRERQWQVVNVATVLVPSFFGEHTFKSGIDVNAVDAEFKQLADHDGTFRFESDMPFDPLDAKTYPSRYTRMTGEPFGGVDATIVAVSVQDQWRPRDSLTLNVGLRWDYEHSPGVEDDTDNFAPRVAAAFDPWKNGRTSFRSSYGVYYDQVFLTIAHNGLQAETASGIFIVNPGYPDPFGPNPLRGPAPLGRPPTTMRLAEQLVTPFTEQVTIGVQRVLGTSFSLAIDGVWARGQHLLVTRDLNYPNLDQSPPVRPDTRFAQMNSIESTRNSSYRGLQVGLRQRRAWRHSYSVAYTLSLSERDTEDLNFVPQDQRNYSADRSPSLNDARHRLAVSGEVELPLGITLAGVVTARSALPYNVITGTDTNRDGVATTDRPAGVNRNSERGAQLIQADLRIRKTFLMGSRRLELVAEAFNATNRRNWTFPNFVIQGSAVRPTGADIPREVQIGCRVVF